MFTVRYGRPAKNILVRNTKTENKHNSCELQVLAFRREAFQAAVARLETEPPTALYNLCVCTVLKLNPGVFTFFSSNSHLYIFKVSTSGV